MKKFTVSFKRKAVYEEEGYITVEATSASAAKRIALEILDEGKDPCDYEGDVTDMYFVPDSPLPDSEAEIISVEKDDFLDENDRDEEFDDEYEEFDDEFID